MKESLLALSLFFIFRASIVLAVDINIDTIPERQTPGIDFLRLADTTELPSMQLLETAIAGYKLLYKDQSLKRTEVITIIDFSLPSSSDRLWVVDLLHGKVLYHCLVSHGRNSGDIMAQYFSNKPGSNASSPGFYVTGETYTGKHGLSLALDGLETGINDKARSRSIVIHGADYVSPDFIRKYGRLGRSLGCPAVPDELCEEIIQTIKGGSCLFIYAPEKSYISNSPILKKITPTTEGQI